MTTGQNVKVLLRSRPKGWPLESNFDVVTESIPTPGPGEILLQHHWLSLDPYMRGRNSWRLHLAEVATVELLEVQLVNAVAPFVLNARLRPLLAKVPTRDAHDVTTLELRDLADQAADRAHGARHHHGLARARIA